MKKMIYFSLFLIFTFVNAGAQTMSVSYRTISDHNSEYNIDATYPQVTFGPDALMGVRGIAQDINSSLDTTVNGIINDFKNQTAGIKKLNGITSSLSINGIGWINNGWLLCNELTTFTNISGMAHPMTTKTTFNFTTDGKGPLTLSSLFKIDSDYLSYISNFSIKDLKAYAAKEGYNNIDDMITDGAAPKASNFENWIVKNDSLVLIFNPYQVAPYVFGIQTVAMPLSDLTSMIDPKGPLEYMYR